MPTSSWPTRCCARISPTRRGAVYQRVAEHDPKNERAKAAIAMLAPVVAAPPQAKPEKKVAAKDPR